MRSSIILSSLLLAATTFASPVNNVKRGIYTANVLEVVTDVVWVETDGKPVTTSHVKGSKLIKLTHTTSSTSTTPTTHTVPTTTPTTSSTSSTPPPPTTTPTTTPAPTPTPTPTSTYVPQEFFVSQSSAAPTTSAASSGGSGASDTYSSSALKAHNDARSAHGAPALNWDAGLASTAAQIASSCVFAHDTSANGGGYGQNIAAGDSAAQIYDIIFSLFYESEAPNFSPFYGQSTPDDMSNFENWGHFTQVVWASTSSVGCASQACGYLSGGGADMTFTVCNYAGAGMFILRRNEFG
jgi:uncharacterized protein YkwD